MEVLIAGAVVLAVAYLVIAEIRSTVPHDPAPTTLGSTANQDFPPAARHPDLPAFSGSMLGALGPTEPDRRTRPLRRTAAALMLTVVTLAIASGVGGVIYLGLRRLG